MAKNQKSAPEIELVSDAWPRFERFVRDIAKAGPQHRTASKRKAKSVGRKKKETAPGAALQTGAPPNRKPQESVDKKRS